MSNDFKYYSIRRPNGNPIYAWGPEDQVYAYADHLDRQSGIDFDLHQVHEMSPREMLGGDSLPPHLEELSDEELGRSVFRNLDEPIINFEEETEEIRAQMNGTTGSALSGYRQSSEKGIRTMQTRRQLLALLSVFVAVPASAQDLFDLYTNSVSKAPFVAFLARESPGASGVPGHSFVGFGVELDNGLTVYENLLGFYPKGGAYEVVKATFSSTSGELKSIIEDVAWSVELRVYPSEEKFEDAKKVAQAWMSDTPKYNLFANGGKNCSVFASEVAAELGLNVPSGPGSKLPINFISEMKELN